MKKRQSFLCEEGVQFDDGGRSAGFVVVIGIKYIFLQRFVHTIIIIIIVRVHCYLNIFLRPIRYLLTGATWVPLQNYLSVELGQGRETREW